MKSVMLALLFTTACIPSQAAFAAEPDYVDDRSDAAAVIRSFYNAVSRREYARAWDYFGEGRPAASFEAFVAGYETTDRVDVETGAVSEEGAAGSVFFRVPVAIRATATDGTEKVYAGCYTLRQVNARIQEPPFQPILIEEGSLQPSSVELVDALPASCGGSSQPPGDAVLEQAKDAFAATYGERCTRPSDGKATQDPQAFTLSSGGNQDGVVAAPSQARLFRFVCSMAAYNEEAVYYLHDEDGGLRQLQFATPELDIHYAGTDSQEEVEAIAIIGFRAHDRLVNSGYDEGTMTIVSNARWRGPGDASDSGRWLYRNGHFTLVRYEVDASYDGAVNPETVLDYETPP
jgi:hypothetical protein